MFNKNWPHSQLINAKLNWECPLIKIKGHIFCRAHFVRHEHKDNVQ